MMDERDDFIWRCYQEREIELAKAYAEVKVWRERATDLESDARQSSELLWAMCCAVDGREIKPDHLNNNGWVMQAKELYAKVADLESRLTSVPVQS